MEGRVRILVLILTEVIPVQNRFFCGEPSKKTYNKSVCVNNWCKEKYVKTYDYYYYYHYYYYHCY